MRVLIILLIVNVCATLSVWYQLHKLRAEITNAKETMNNVVTVVDGLRVSVAGSLVEKASLLKDGYMNVKDGIKDLFTKFKDIEVKE